MAAEMQDHPMYRHARRISAASGRALLDIYGAHGLSIEWMDLGNDRIVGLVFYIAPEVAGTPGTLPVPETIEVVAEGGEVVAVPTRVVIAPTDTFE